MAEKDRVASERTERCLLRVPELEDTRDQDEQCAHHEEERCRLGYCRCPEVNRRPATEIGQADATVSRPTTAEIPVVEKIVIYGTGAGASTEGNPECVEVRRTTQKQVIVPAQSRRSRNAIHCREQRHRAVVYEPLLKVAVQNVEDHSGVRDIENPGTVISADRGTDKRELIQAVGPCRNRGRERQRENKRENKQHFFKEQATTSLLNPRVFPRA